MAAESERIGGYDLARAIAVMAMVVVNYSSMMQVGHYPWPWLKSAVEFLYGRAATLFIMLAGVSITLMARPYTSSSTGRVLQIRLLKRSLLLLFSGFALWIWWVADILHFYALYIAIGTGLVSWSDKALQRLTLAVIWISMPVSALLTAAYDLGDLAAAVKGHGFLIRLLWDYAVSSNYSLLPWLSYFLFGMLIGRRNQNGAVFYKRCVWQGMLVCLFVELFSMVTLHWVSRQDWEIEGNFWLAFLRSDAFPATPLFILSSGGCAVALIGLCRLADGIIWCRLKPAINLFKTFGQLSFTFYIAHLVWGAVFISWVGSKPAGINAKQMLSATIIFYTLGLSLAWYWGRRFRRGPVETLFHRLTRDKADSLIGSKSNVPNEILLEGHQRRPSLGPLASKQRT